jgi:glycerophosphoryl diester phosphodiesterase
MWTDLPHPAVIAHRGDKALAPENTLAAFNLAVNKGADAIEFDVKLTADGQVIVLHDQRVDRTTNGTGSVSSYKFAALRELDAGAWFSEQFRGERIPGLEEVFETFGKQIYMNVELTNYATPADDLVVKVVDLVKKHGLQRRTLFSSFVIRNLRKARSLLPEVLCGLLTMHGWLGFWGRKISWRNGFYSLHSHITDTNSGLLNRVHATGTQVYVWTVNTEKDIKKMIGLGVDAIFTDDPGLALWLLGRSL